MCGKCEELEEEFERLRNKWADRASWIERVYGHDAPAAKTLREVLLETYELLHGKRS